MDRCLEHLLVALLPILAPAAEGRLDGQEGQDAKALRQMEIVACLERVMNMNMLEIEVISLLSCLSS